MAMLPPGPPQGVAVVVVVVMVIFTPVQLLVATTVKLLEPEQPLLFFATIVYVPAARLLNVPDDWKAPLFRLKLKPLPPVAVAVMLPLL